MFVIDISKILPLDILLTTGGAKESTLIKVGQSIIRGEVRFLTCCDLHRAHRARGVERRRDCV